MGDRPPADPASGRRLDLAVVGHINLDHFLDVGELPERDRTVPITAQRTELGGTATNIARVAAHWGVAVGLVSRIGEDFPAGFERRLLEERVDLSGVERVRGAVCSACYIVEDGNGAQMTFIDQGPMRDARRAALPSTLWANVDWVHLGTGDPEYLERIATAARSGGAHLAADPAQEIHYRWDRARLLKMLGKAEIFFGNRSEVDRALELLKLPDRRALLKVVPMVVETRGAKGAIAHTRAGTVSVAARTPRRLRQVTGAGDAFRGGFYAGWFAGQTLRGCLVAGTRAASAWMQGDHAVPAGRGSDR
ncbi:MAG: PfkB family carbohydrate kinase [Thermoplasmata archaeon]|nr:PfkB family carbohydrate kinase [Thermoplasmata archaeon]